MNRTAIKLGEAFWKGKSLITKIRFPQSDSQVLLDRGELSLRNSDTFELKLFKVESKNMTFEPINIQFPANATLQDLAEHIEKEVPCSDLKFYSEEQVPISQMTPVEALMNRFFSLRSNEYRIKIEGQFLHPDLSYTNQEWKNQIRETLKQVEHPVLIQREIENYLHRVDSWLDAKYGIDNQQAKIRLNQVQDILVQAIRDPDCQWSTLRQIQLKWREVYDQVEELQKKYEEAVAVSSKMAKQRMYLDLFLMMSNVVFISGGTYVVYSWDIIEPWAYFISSMAGIYLFRKAAQFRKPFSLNNYKNHLIYQVYLPKAAEKVGINLNDYQIKRKELKLVQSTFKDYLLTKL